MRRTADSAAKVRHALRARGLTVSARRLEGWSTAKLEPSSDLAFEHQIDHYDALFRLSGKGIDADLTAFRLAAAGFGCERLRPALLRKVSVVEPVDIPRIDLTTGESGDPGFQYVEAAARQAASDMEDVFPKPIMKLIRALQRNAAKFAEKASSKGEKEEAEEVWHSFLVNSIGYLFGGEFYNATAMAAVSGIDPSTIQLGDLDEFNKGVRLESVDVDRAYLTLPVDQIVAMAVLLHEHAERAVRYLEIENMSASEIDFLCAVFAPMLVYAVKLFRDQICVAGTRILDPVLVLIDQNERIPVRVADR